MYPIERTDYINAHIGAISEEMRDARIEGPRRGGRTGSLDRFSKAVARLLRTSRVDPGLHRAANPPDQVDQDGSSSAWAGAT